MKITVDGQEVNLYVANDFDSPTIVAVPVGDKINQKLDKYDEGDDCIYAPSRLHEKLSDYPEVDCRWVNDRDN